jgi:C-terminal processing protease CtpA/Prc
VTVDGKTIEREGVKPDVEVLPTASDLLAQRDRALEAAVAHLNAKRSRP